jgi:3-methyl-2-oxobutanoate hydroxymethyltransferase
MNTSLISSLGFRRIATVSPIVSVADVDANVADMLKRGDDANAQGAEVIVLECIPASLGKRITEAVDIPVIGIGAGNECDGQVLVIYDLLGITPGKRPRFAKDFLAELPAGKGVSAAIKAYVDAVKRGDFPDEAHSFN